MTVYIITYTFRYKLTLISLNYLRQKNPGLHLGSFPQIVKNFSTYWSVWPCSISPEHGLNILGIAYHHLLWHYWNHLLSVDCPVLCHSLFNHLSHFILIARLGVLQSSPNEWKPSRARDISEGPCSLSSVEAILTS